MKGECAVVGSLIDAGNRHVGKLSGARGVREEGGVLGTRVRGECALRRV